MLLLICFPNISNAKSGDEDVIVPRYKTIRNSSEIRAFEQRFSQWKIQTENKNKAEIDSLNSDYKSKSHDSDYYCKLGKILYLQEHYREALFNLNNSIRLDNKNTEAYIYRGYTGIKLDMLESSMKDALFALKINPQSADALSIKGRCLSNAGNMNGAIREYTKALNYCRDNKLKTHLLSSIAACYGSLNNRTKAEHFHKQAIAVCEDKIQKAWCHIWYLFFKGSLAKLPEYFDRLLVCSPFESDAFIAKGLFKEQKTDKTEALYNYEKARIISDYKRTYNSEKKNSALVQMGKILLYNKYTDEALPLLNKAIMIDNKSSDAYYYRALAHACNRNVENSKADFMQVIQLEPKSKNAENSKKAIELLKQGIMP
jgi:tetratricopeptide (TPR) repeat protein